MCKEAYDTPFNTTGRNVTLRPIYLKHLASGFASETLAIKRTKRDASTGYVCFLLFLSCCYSVN
jgi:hypothetical protein